MAIIISILNKANPGQPSDDNTPDIDLTYKVYNDTDGYSTPQLFGSSVTDPNVVINSGLVTISGVTEPFGVLAYKISSIDEEGLESPFSDAFNVGVGGYYIQSLEEQGMSIGTPLTSLSYFECIFQQQEGYGVEEYNFLLVGDSAYQNNLAIVEDGLFWGGYATPTSWSINGEAGTVGSAIDPTSNPYFGGKKLSDYTSLGDITVIINFGTNNPALLVDYVWSGTGSDSGLGGVCKKLVINAETFPMTEGAGLTTTGDGGTVLTFDGGTHWVKAQLTPLFEDNFAGTVLSAQWTQNQSANCSQVVDDYLAFTPDGTVDEAPYSSSAVAVNPIAHPQHACISFDVYMAIQEAMPEVFVGWSLSNNATITLNRWGMTNIDVVATIQKLFQWVGYGTISDAQSLSVSATKTIKIEIGFVGLNKIRMKYWNATTETWDNLGSISQATSTMIGEPMYPIIAMGDEIGRGNNMVISNYSITDYEYFTKRPQLDAKEIDLTFQPSNLVNFTQAGTVYTSTVTNWNSIGLADDVLTGDGYYVIDLLSVTESALFKFYDKNSNDAYDSAEGVDIFITGSKYYSLVCDGSSAINSGITPAIGDRVRIIRSGSNIKAEYLRGGVWTLIIDFGNATAIATGDLYLQISAGATGVDVVNPRIYQ